MKMNKKLITMLAALGLVGCVGVGSTLAYLTDTTAPVVNTFTVGEVKIDLIESQYHRSNAGVYKETDTDWRGTVDAIGDLVDPDDYSKAHNWNSKYLSDKLIKEDAVNYKEENGYFTLNSQNLVPGKTVRKCPYVVNTGKNSAYVRERVYAPVNMIEAGASFSLTSTAWIDGEVLVNGVKYRGGDYVAEDKKMALDDNVGHVTRDGVEYLEYTFTFVQPVEPGEMTFWNCIGGVEIKESATAETLKKMLKADGSFDIIIEADAIQAEGFDDALTAFATFDKEKKN